MAIGSHVIPRFYLEQFSVPSTRKGKPGRIYVYEKGKQPVERSTKAQGRENGYFGFVLPDGKLEESMESRLAQLENGCNDTLWCAKSKLFDWTSSFHRNKLAFYAALLFQRATQNRNVNLQHWDNIQKEFAEVIPDDKYVGDLARHLSVKLKKNITLEEMRGHLQHSSDRMQNKSEAKNAYLDKLLWQTEFIKNILLEKPWQVWKATDGIEFVASDNPLISFVRLQNGELHPGWGFRRPGVIAALPLSPGVCLAMGPSGPESVTLDELHVMKVNEVMISLCDRFVYSRNHSGEIKKLVHECAGAAKYGVTAFVPAGIEMPSFRAFVRHHLGLPPEES